MTTGLTDPVDITHLPLREGALAISEGSEFTVGTISVDYTELLGDPGVTYRGLALEEARALGSHMLGIDKRLYYSLRVPAAQILRVEPRKAMAPGNVVLETIPLFDTELDKTNGRLVLPHSWTFGVHGIVSANRRPDLFSVSLNGELEGGSADEQESYHRSMRRLAGGPITADRLPDPARGEPEDPNDLFYVAELGLVRAARRLLGDIQATPVIK